MLPCLALAATPTSDLLRGEHIIHLSPLPDYHWSIQPPNEREQIRKSMAIERTTWDADTQADRVIEQIAHGKRTTDFAPLRDADRRTGQKACSFWSASDEFVSRENGYKTAAWLAHCKLPNDERVTTMKKYIAGDDSTYIITRVWNGIPSTSQIDRWRTYLRDVIVCNSNTTTHPCPTELKKAKPA
jgi:hypothetical protein